MSAVATNRLTGSTAATEILVLEPVAQRLGLAPILLVPGEMTIGSSPDCQVQLNVPGVQAHHCVITSSRSRVSMRAMDPRTWHNNLPSPEGWLRVGDRLAIGPVEFRVRRAEPWDVLPAASESSVPATATNVAQVLLQSSSEQERVRSFEAQLLRQITNLEAEVARHQSAVARLEQQASMESSAVAASDDQPALTTKPSSRLTEHDAHPKFTAPRFHLLPSSSDTGHEPDRLREELETYQREARKQLAELAVRNEALNRQCQELAAQWDQLRELIAEQESATIERSQREQQLYERERRCAFQESEVSRRSQRLSEELDKVAARLLQLQSEADHLAGQSAMLTQREQSLAERTRQLDVRDSEIEAARQSLEQREAACRDAEAAAESWHQLRDATESRWAQRAEELETQTAIQHAQAEELAQRQQACEQSIAEIRNDRQQLLDDRAHLEGWSQELSQLQAALAQQQQELEAIKNSLQTRDNELELRDAECTQMTTNLLEEREHLHAEQQRLATWNEELTQSQSVFNHQQQKLAVEASSLQAEAQEFVLREYAWEQIVSTTQHEQERLDAERTRLDDLHSELLTQQSELTVRQHELDALAARLNSESEQLAQRELGIQQSAADLQQDQDRIHAEDIRLAAWNSELAIRQSELERQQQDLAQQSAQLADQRDELSRREQAWEETVTATEHIQEQILTERHRLEAWHSELSARETSHAADQHDLQTRQAAWEAERRAEADSAANALTNDYSNLERMREEFVLAERELEQVEGDLRDWEAALEARAAELSARERELQQAEIECAWHLRAQELAASTRSNTAPDELTNGLEVGLAIVSAERDSLATELFMAAQLVDDVGRDLDQVSDQRRLEAAQLAREVADCQRQRSLLNEAHLALETNRQELADQQRKWQAEQQLIAASTEALQMQLSAEKEILEAGLTSLQSREVELATQRDQLHAERAELDRLAHELRQQQASLDQLSQDLDQQQQELTSRLAEQSSTDASELAAKTSLERELAEAQADLSAQQERLEAAQRNFERERQAWEQDCQAWEEQLASGAEPDAAPASSSEVMDALSRLGDIVQSELDHDVQPELGDEPSDPFEAIRAQYGVLQSDFDRDELPEETDRNLDEAPRSLWAADTSSETPAQDDATPELPATEENLSALDLRARLAEMFSFDLSAHPTEANTHDLPEEIDESDVLASAAHDGELRPEDAAELEQSPVPSRYQEPDHDPAPASDSDEPVADEYDSVESYMQRLLDRNRKSRAGEEPAPERYVSQSTSSVTRSNFTPVQPQDVSEFDDSVASFQKQSAPVPEVERTYAPRGPVDTLKMRAGLDSLRQVANISARHAIARSKWKKMRTRVALQSALTGGAGLLGLSILTGKWLGVLGTNLWGWVALAIAAVLGSKVAMDIRWIYQGERRRERDIDTSGESDTTSASDVSDTDGPEMETSPF